MSGVSSPKSHLRRVVDSNEGDEGYSNDGGGGGGRGEGGCGCVGGV